LTNGDQRGIGCNAHVPRTNDAGNHRAVNIAIMKGRRIVRNNEVRARFEVRKLLMGRDTSINDGNLDAFARGQRMQPRAVFLLRWGKRR